MSEKKENSVIDLESIDNLRKLQKPGRPDLLSALIDLFTEASFEDMKKIREASQHNDVKSVSGAAHSLKSSAANLGALGFSKLCLELETKGPNPDVLAQLETEYGKVIQELKSFKVAA